MMGAPAPRPALIGVNVCYLRDDYGHDLAPNPRYAHWPCSFDPLQAYRPIIEARSLGFGAVRVWLCEKGEGILLDGERVVGVHERLLDAVQTIQEAARLNGVRVYWTLLDGNAWRREQDPITRSILADPAQTLRFAERVVRPLVAGLDPHVTLAVEVVNEPETCTRECVGEGVEAIGWPVLGAAIRTCGDAVRAEADLWVTAGTAPVFLPRLWPSGSGITAVDVHVYHPGGGLPSRGDLARDVRDDALLDEALPILGGELGIPKGPGPQSESSLCNYIYNADRLGYAAAFLWKLEGDLVDKSRPERPTTALCEHVRHALCKRAGGREPYQRV